MGGYGHRWTEELVKSEILSCMEALSIDRMPTSRELLSLNRNDLHQKISKTKKYEGWANYLGIARKYSLTLMGQEYESFAVEQLSQRGHSVERMSTKHPFDLLVNDNIKIDVKTGSSYFMRGSRVHSFGITKKEATCDLYIIMALGEKGDIERTFIIPSKFLKVISLCIGKQSKYNRFIDRWDYISQFSQFYDQLS